MFRLGAARSVGFARRAMVNRTALFSVDNKIPSDMDQQTGRRLQELQDEAKGEARPPDVRTHIHTLTKREEHPAKGKTFSPAKKRGEKKTPP